MEGGSKEATEIHDKIVEELQKKHDYTEEQARAIKSLLYDEAKKELSSSEQGVNLERAKYMKKLITKKHLSTFTDKQIQDRINLMKEKKASKKSGLKKSSKKAGVKKTSKKIVRKTSKKAGVKKTSKKVIKKSSKKAGVKKTSKKVIKKSSKKAGVKKTSKKTVRKISKKNV
jgi:hypothetical protein